MVTGHKDAKGDFHPHTKSSGGVSENDLKISVKGNNDVISVQPKKSSEKSEKKGTMFWKNNKAYKVDINPLYVAVDEMFQDGNHKWHQGKTVYFAQGDEQIKQLEEDAGGLYVNTIMDFLDSAGALEKPDRDRKEQSLSDLKWSNFTSYARTFDSLNKSSKERLILDAGIPMKNYEPFTIQDAKEYSEKPFDKLPDLTQKRIKQILFKVMDAQLHNEAYTH